MSVARCQNCGAPLELADGARRARCGYCQHDQDVSALVKAVAAPAAPPSAGSRYRSGQPVLCEWRGQWWPASVLEVLGDDLYSIHYDGYSSSWDETVNASRLALRSAKVPRAARASSSLVVGVVVVAVIVVVGLATAVMFRGVSSSPSRSATSAPAVYAAPGQLVLGQAVVVRWSGQWWNATVIGLHADGRVRVHYDGWASTWDEDVTLNRVGLR
jgi:LSD1 subclass zinc finger protein